MKNIVVIGTTDCQGGAAKVGWDLGHKLISDGYNVKYLVGYKKSTKPYVAELAKPPLLKYLDDHTHYNLTATIRHGRSFILANNIDFGASSEILNHPWYKSADIVHCHNLHGNFFRLDTLIKISQAKPVVWTLHDMWSVTGKCAYTTNSQKWSDGYHSCGNLMSYPPMLWDNTNYLWHRKQNIYQQLSNTTIVTPSRWLEKIVASSMLKHLPHKTIYNGINTSLFKPQSSDIRTQLGIPANAKLILFIAQGGLSDPRKGYEYIEQVRNHYLSDQNVYFLALGDGNAVTRHENIISLPFVSDPKVISEYYAAADLLLFPSLAENCPLVILEAMATGLPVVAFNVGGVSELISHKQNGYIAKYQNYKDLLAGLNWILNLSTVKLNQLRAQNRKHATTHYSIDAMTDQYLKLYSSLA